MTKTFRNSLLVTTAAAALVAGITISAAQGGGVGGGPTGGGMSSGAAPSGGGAGVERQGTSGDTHSGNLGTHGKTQTQTGKSRQQTGHASDEERGKAPSEQRGVRGQNDIDKSRTGTQTGETREQRAHTYGEERSQRGDRGNELGEQRGTQELRGQRGRAFGEERNERFRGNREGTAGFAREHLGRSVELSSEQRTRIHGVFEHERDRYRVGHVDFDIREGVRIPRRFHLYTLPSDIVEVVPAYRGYRFFYYEDQIVIVDPVTLEIVAVIPA
jgi:hypothetical protein